VSRCFPYHKNFLKILFNAQESASCTAVAVGHAEASSTSRAFYNVKVRVKPRAAKS